MKFGILTFHNIPNIGALLQAYALCKAIRLLGFNCEIIDYRCENIIKRELCFNKTPIWWKNIIAKFNWKKTERKILSCNEYMKELDIYSKEQYTRNSISRANSVYDCFISGSDMIWNLDVTGYDYSFFLDFTEDNKKRVSLASSIGEKWKENDVPQIINLLKRYNSISVREEDTSLYLRNHGLENRHLCDPTMLLSAKEWLSTSIEPQDKDYVLVYFPTKDLLQAAAKYAKNRDLKIIVLNWGIPKLGYLNRQPNTPPEWLGYIRKANAIFTNSYHGLLFALYFHRPVWTANYGNRIASLLDSLSLTGCFLKNDSEFFHTIDYNKVQEKLDEIQLSALSYIKNKLNFHN